MTSNGFNRKYINIIVSVVILVLIGFTVIQNVRLHKINESIKSENERITKAMKECTDRMMIYEARIEGLNNVIDTKDTQIDNITRMNVSLLEQIKIMRQDVDRMTKHYIEVHDSLLFQRKKMTLK